MIEHVTRLLEDPRLVIDTTRGRRPVVALVRDVARSDKAVEVKRQMADLGRPDRALQERMPAGEQVDVSLSAKSFWIFKKAVGHLRVVCVSPTRDLLKGTDVKPMDADAVQSVLRSMPPPVSKVPITVVLVSTGGFERDARELVERTADRTLILAEPNVDSAGGWNVFGPVETKALVDLFDPEEEDDKRSRVRAEIESSKFDLTSSGISAERVAGKTKLPLQLVEAELKSYAKENAGLQAKRLDGRVVLFREGSMTSSAPVDAAAAGGGLTGMPLIDRIKSLFARKGETEKKVAFLSERRAALSQQRDRAYEEITSLEAKDGELREEFKKARAPLTKRRITSQLVQLRKDIERKQQMITVLNQQVNVVNTHLHNLELTKQGESAQLPDSEEIAADAAAAEEMLAQLEADNELADSVSGVGSSMAGMSAEEQALFEELEAEAKGPDAPVTATPTDAEVAREEEVNAMKQPTNREPASPQKAQTEKRAEPEAG